MPDHRQHQRQQILQIPIHRHARISLTTAPQIIQRLARIHRSLQQQPLVRLPRPVGLGKAQQTPGRAEKRVPNLRSDQNRLRLHRKRRQIDRIGGKRGNQEVLVETVRGELHGETEKRGNLEVGGVRFEEAPDLTVGDGEGGGVGMDLGNALVASEFPVDHEETAGGADG